MGTNPFNLITDETYNEKMTVKNNLLRILAESNNSSIIPNSWDYVQFLVRNNLHTKVLHIGDELICQKDGVNISWIIVDMDADIPIDPQFTNSLTLVMKNQWDEEIQFDGREAVFYFENGLSAGTYYFTIGAQPWYANDVNKSFMFTLNTDIPAEGQLVLRNDYNKTCLNANISSYSSSSSTVELETVAITLWDEETGTSLGTIENNIQSNINSIQRALSGSNNYKESAIRQWLNSSAAAGNVWEPQTKFDRPPSWRDTLKGFMNGIDEDFLSVVKPVSIKTARNTVTDGGGFDTTQDNFFLLSKSQIYGGTTINGVDEGGTPYEYFSHYSDLRTAGAGNDKNRIKTRNGSANWYRLRSPNANHGSSIWSVSASGLLYYHYDHGATSVGGVAAACTIY